MNMNNSLDQQMQALYTQTMNQNNVSQVAQMQSDARQMSFSQDRPSMASSLWGVTLGQDKLRMTDPQRDQIGRELGYRMANTGANVMDSAGQLGTSLAGLLAPGIGPMLWSATAGLAIGGVANVAHRQLDTRMQNESFLANNSYRMVSGADSTSKYGTGFDLKQQGDLAKYMAHVGTDKFLDSKEIQDILQTSTDGDMLRNIKGVQDFKDKFSKIIDNVKTMAVGLHESMQEATKFMGEMQRAGIGGQDAMSTRFGMKATADLIGANDQQLKSTLLSASQSTVANTNGSLTSAIGSNELGMIMAHNYLQRSETAGDEKGANLIRNANYGGKTGQEAAGLMMNASSDSMLGNKEIQYLAAGAFDFGKDGNISFSDDKMKSLLGSGNIQGMSDVSTANLTKSGITSVEYMAQIQSIMSNLTPEQKQQLVNGIANNIGNSEMFKGVSKATAIGQVTGGQVSGTMAQMVSAQSDEFTKSGAFSMDQRKYNSFFGLSAAEADVFNVPLLDKMKYGAENFFQNSIGDMMQPGADLGARITEQAQQMRTGVPNYQSYKSSYAWSQEQQADPGKTLVDQQQKTMDAQRGALDILKKHDISLGTGFGTEISQGDAVSTAWYDAVKSGKTAQEMIKPDTSAADFASGKISDTMYESLKSNSVGSLSGSQLINLDKIANRENDGGFDDRLSTEKARLVLGKQDGTMNWLEQKSTGAMIEMHSAMEGAYNTITGAVSSDANGTTVEQQQKLAADIARLQPKLLADNTKALANARKTLAGSAGKDMNQDQQDKMFAAIKAGNMDATTSALANAKIDETSDAGKTIIAATSNSKDYGDFVSKNKDGIDSMGKQLDFAQKVSVKGGLEALFAANLKDANGDPILDKGTSNAIFGKADSEFKDWHIFGPSTIKDTSKMTNEQITSLVNKSQGEIKDGLKGLSPEVLSRMAGRMVSGGFGTKEELMPGGVADVDKILGVLNKAGDAQSQKDNKDPNAVPSQVAELNKTYNSFLTAVVAATKSATNTVNGSSYGAGPTFPTNSNTNSSPGPTINLAP